MCIMGRVHACDLEHSVSRMQSDLGVASRVNFLGNARADHHAKQSDVPMYTPPRTSDYRRSSSLFAEKAETLGVPKSRLC